MTKTLITCAEDLASRVCGSKDWIHSAEGSSLLANRVFMRLFGTLPSEEDRAACLQFLSAQVVHFRETAHSSSGNSKITPDVQAVAVLCQTLLASNRFMYLD